MTTSPDTPADRPWLAVAFLLTGNFMNLIDVTIVNVALPTLEQELGAESNLIEWIVAGYTFAFALALLPAGRLGDAFGRRRMFLIGMTVFVVASALAGLAPGLWWLVAARVIQGAGGAMMTPQTLAMVPNLFPPEKRGAVFGLFALAAGLASVTGPILGGLLIGWDIFGLSWRPIFLVNLPVGLLAMLGAMRFVPAIPGQRDVGIDSVGIALAAMTLLGILMPLVEAPAIGWRPWMGVLLAVSPLSLWAFLRWERRQAARGAPQLLPVHLVAQPRFRTGAGLAAVLFSAIPGFFLCIALFFQSGFGLTPLQSGLMTVPFSAGVLLASPVASRLGSDHLRVRIVAGTLFLATCYIAIRFTIGATGETIHWAAFAPWFALGGFGLGTTVSPLFQIALAGAGLRDSGSASGATQALQQVGATFGVAIMGGLFFATLGDAPVGDHAAYRDAARTALLYATTAALGIAVIAVMRPASALRAEAPEPISGAEADR